MTRLHVCAFVCAVATASLTGCAGMNHAQTNTAYGATAGGILGAVIGHQSDNTEVGAAAGAGIGAITGYIIGNEQDKAENHRY